VTAPEIFHERAGTLGAAVVARISTSRTTSSAGGGEAHPNMQPSLVATYVIKT
jgi:microcystin-dependent protein